MIHSMSKYSTDGGLNSNDTKDPFADDQLSGGAWKRLAESLRNLLTQEPDALTLSIEAPWGSGKTFFLQRLAKFLSQAQSSPEVAPIQFIVLNAWESDYAQDPFVVLLRALFDAFPEQKRDRKIK